MKPSGNPVFAASNEILAQAAVRSTSLDERTRRVVPGQGERVSREATENHQQTENNFLEPIQLPTTPQTLHDPVNKDPKIENTDTIYSLSRTCARLFFHSRNVNL